MTSAAPHGRDEGEPRLHGLLDAPWSTATKPYGTALYELAARRPDIVAIGADLTKQTETDLIRDRLPQQFVNVGMAEQNLIGVASGLARAGRCVYVHTFGVFATRRPYEQVAMQVAYPKLNVKLVGFMPGLSSPGGPSHQAIDDVALMRALPNMTVVDVADATEVRQVVGLLADTDGPCYLRLKRGEVPVLFDDSHGLALGPAQCLRPGSDVSILASGMLVPIALRAAECLATAGVQATVVNVPTIKPIDTDAIVDASTGRRIVVTAENHSIVGGLGSAVAEVLAEAGAACPLRRVGVRDTFAQASSAPWLFQKHGLDVDALVATVWRALGMSGAPPTPDAEPMVRGEYSPV